MSRCRAWIFCPLYDLREDPLETTNVAGDNPEVTALLKEKLLEFPLPGKFRVIRKKLKNFFYPDMVLFSLLCPEQAAPFHHATYWQNLPMPLPRTACLRPSSSA